MLQEVPSSARRPMTSSSSRTPSRSSRLTSAAPAVSRLQTPSTSRPATSTVFRSRRASRSAADRTPEHYVLELSQQEQKQLVERAVAQDIASFPSHLRHHLGHKLIDSSLASMRRMQLNQAIRDSVDQQIKRSTEPEFVRQTALLEGLAKLQSITTKH